MAAMRGLPSVSICYARPVYRPAWPASGELLQRSSAPASNTMRRAGVRLAARRPVTTVDIRVPEREHVSGRPRWAVGYRLRVCLLIALFHVVPGAPLLVAANRDERLDRPAVSATVLREREPRILGGRDLLAGGTWLAVNARGVVVGLTNQPSANGRDPTKLSRGQLPLACASHSSAAAGVAALAADVDPACYNPCWLLAGDRDALFSVTIGPASNRAEIEQLGPGLHVLENAALSAGSRKAAFVRELVEQALAEQPDRGPASTVAALRTVLCDHQPAVPEPRTNAAGRVWPPALTAACVHADGYGTRSAAIVTVPASGMPAMLVADGKPCGTPMSDATPLWVTDPVPEPSG